MWFPPERQGGPMGIWATWVPVGTVVMYLLAPILVTWNGLASVWWFGAAFALLMFVLFAVLIRQPPAQTASSVQPDAHLDIRLALANRDIWLLALEFACFNLALVTLGTYYPTFLNETRGYSLSQAALISSLGTLVILVSAPLAGWFSDRIGSRRLVFSIPFLILAFLLIFPFRVSGWLIIALAIVQGLFVGAVPTASFAAAPEVMRRPEWAGLGLAVILIGQNLGQLVGPVLFGQLAGSLGWVSAGYLLVVVCLAGFASAWLVRIR
jgi:nitrate/nitrite transporter NarK